jgi:replicative DNA helicase
VITKAWDLSGATVQEREDAIKDLAEEFSNRLQLINQSARDETYLQENVGELIDRLLNPRAEDYQLEIAPIRALNLALGRVASKEMVVIAAETSFGKSALALNMACHLALGSQKRKVALFSFEMSKESILQRLISGELSIPLNAIRSRQLSPEQIQQIREFHDTMPLERIIVLDDCFSMDSTDIAARCRQLRARGPLDVVIVDYLQLINPGSRWEGNRQQEVAQMSRRLKLLAHELNMVVIALSQLNDDGKLRESRAIGQDADIVLLIQEAADSEDTFERHIVIDKCRNAARNTRVKVAFHGDYVTFRDI